MTIRSDSFDVLLLDVDRVEWNLLSNTFITVSRDGVILFQSEIAETGSIKIRPNISPELLANLEIQTDQANTVGCIFTYEKVPASGQSGKINLIITETRN